MATQLKLRRGTTAQHSTFTGAEGEVTVDTTKETLVVHDGTTVGGLPLARASEVVALTGNQTIAGVKTFSSTIVGTIDNATNAVNATNATNATTAGTTTGNAATASALATGRTISITGDIAYTSPAFNGSASVTAAATLANSGVTAGSYTTANITVDAKGRVTAASTGSGSTVIPAHNAIGSVQGFFCTFGTSQLAGTTISGSYLFDPTAIGTAVQPNTDPGIQMIFGSARDLNNTSPTGTKVNRTTAFSLSSSTNAVTLSPTTGTWRLLTPNIKAFYVGGCGATTIVSSVMAVRIS